MSDNQLLEAFVGRKPNGDKIFEKIVVSSTEKGFRVEQTPLFAGTAKHDLIKAGSDNAIKVIEHGGNLNIRVVSRTSSRTLLDFVAQSIEGLGGEVSNLTDRFFTITIHVSCEFRAIEEILESMTKKFPDTVWAYTNVFNENGEPLNWWQAILAEK